jgi:hypothetical protein
MKSTPNRRDMDLKLVHSTGDQGYLHMFTERALSFNERYDSDADPNIFAETIAAEYFNPQPKMLCFIVMAGSVPVAHCMFVIEEFYGDHVVNMLQYEKDDGWKVPNEFKAEVYQFVVDWCSLMGVKKIRIIARNDEVARIFEKKYGFERSERVIMNQSLQKVADRMAELPTTPESKEDKDGHGRRRSGKHNHPGGPAVPGRSVQENREPDQELPEGEPAS